VKEEERQLNRSMLHVSQDPMVGNSQKASAFWKHIFQHYDERRTHGFRPTWSLETKWGHIKHDVAKFIGMHQQCVSLNKSGSNAADVLKHMEELYWIKNPKNSEFTFQHIWFMVKDMPWWDEGWMHEKATRTPPSKRKGLSSNYRESDCILVDAIEESDGLGRADLACSFVMARPRGVKHAKEDIKQGKIRKHKQVAASETMAVATMRKAAILEEANMLMLMTLPDSQVTAPEAIEYLQLR
jgi:hypothetical protein